MSNDFDNYDDNEDDNYNDNDNDNDNDNIIIVKGLIWYFYESTFKRIKMLMESVKLWIVQKVNQDLIE